MTNIDNGYRGFPGPPVRAVAIHGANGGIPHVCNERPPDLPPVYVIGSITPPL